MIDKNTGAIMRPRVGQILSPDEALPLACRGVWACVGAHAWHAHVMIDASRCKRIMIQSSSPKWVYIGPHPEDELPEESP